MLETVYELRQYIVSILPLARRSLGKLYEMATKRPGLKNAPRRRVMVEETDYDMGDMYPHIPLSTHVNQFDFNDDKEKPSHEKRSLRGDYGNIALLTFLYILQGVPLGLSGAIPMLLQSRKISYKEQAVFSFVYWPFSIKLLWAPIVDSLFITRVGRRKSWMVPTQYLIGVFMIFLSFHVTDILGDGTANSGVNITSLTAIFFMLNFLAATQDIAVDGWALTMLSKANVGWASTCNSVGQTAGYFLGNVLFLALESAAFCNKYLRSVPQPEGILTLSGFLHFWGIIFFVTTTLVWLLKREKDDPDFDPDQGVVATYKLLLRVICLPAVISYSIIVLTAKMGFPAADSLTSLKLIEAGLPKEQLAVFAIPMIPVQIALPIFISKYTSGPRPMNVFLKAYPFRLLLGLVYCAIVYWCHTVQPQPGVFPWYFYAVLLSFYALHQVFVYSIFVAQMAFHAKISDPAIGGTYMTLLNTLANLGGNWPSTLALWAVDYITWKSCEGADGSCDSSAHAKACTEAGGKCHTTLDGYYIESLVCIFIGFIWLQWRGRRLRQLDSLDTSEFKTS